MDFAKWNAKLDSACDEGSVVAIVRDHLAEWPAAALDALPDHCRPGPIADGDDVTGWAYVLTSAHCHCESCDGNHELLLTLANFFAHASQRLAMVAALAIPSHTAHRLFFDSFIGSTTNSRR
jgi:hypothetical protein